MSVSIEAKTYSDTPYLHIKPSGTLTSELLNIMLARVADESHESGINRFLFDLRESPNKASTSAHFNAAYYKSNELKFSILSKHALLVSPADKGDYYFVETVLLNSRHQCKMFVEDDHAITWLIQ